MPVHTQGIFYGGTYIYGKQDPVSGPGDKVSWNEIDVAFETAADGSSFNYHQSLFAPVEVKDIQKLPFQASKGWHTYRVDWSESAVVWSLDGKVTHKVVAAQGAPVPWRPMEPRLIFRTQIGDKIESEPDSEVFVRRVSFTPSALL